MPEDDNPHGEENGPQNPPPPINSNPIRPPNHAPSQEPEKQPHWADRTIAVFTVLIFLTYIASDYFLWRQLQITAGQLEQMKGGSAQTDNLITATRNLAEAAKSQADSAAAQAGSMKDLAIHALAQAASAKNLADASKTQLSVMQAGQRPWLGLGSQVILAAEPTFRVWMPNPNRPDTVAVEITIDSTFVIHNYGTSPAFSTRSLMSVEIPWPTDNTTA